jgi:hypothetical protein
MTDSNMTEGNKGLPAKAYEVGYGKPPEKKRFQPGQSGNPRGRPKKPRSIRDRFARELERKIAVREGDKVRKIPKIDLWVRRIIADAIKGDHRASRILLEMRSASDEEIARGVAEQNIEELNTADQEILDRHLAKLTRMAGKTDADGSD